MCHKSLADWLKRSIIISANPIDQSYVNARLRSTNHHSETMTDVEHTPLLWCVDELNVATRRGRVVRKVRERYLRDDLSCSLAGCALCSADDDASAATHVLGTTKTLLAENPREGVYLLPSMKTVLLQMDALEFSTKKKKKADASEVFADVIVLETVWEFVKRQDLGVYNRLRALLMNADRRFVVFANEHHRACFVQKKQLLPRGFKVDTLEDDKDTVEDAPLETEQQRNERAVATAWRWYAVHLEELQRQDVKVQFLANDAEDLQHAEQFGVTGGVTIADFLKPVAPTFPELQDLLSASAAEEKEISAEGVSSTKGRGGKKKLYPEHLSSAELLAGIKNKRYFKGTIRCNRDHWLECHVLIHGANGVKIPVLLQGREHINRAIDGDLVAIQLLPKAQWKTPSDSFAANGTAAAAAAEEADDDKDEQPEPVGVAEPTVSLEQVALVQSDATQHAKPAGRVVGIIQRNWRKFCGSLEPPRDAAALNASGSCLVVPVDRKVPKIKIQTRQQEALMDKRLLVAIDSWPADSKFPLGHYVRTLGVIGDKETETNVLLIEHDIPCDQFSDEVMRCLPPEDWKITPENSQGRRDLRHLPVMSIDPPNCKDIDDALHAKLLPNGNLQIGVHIADVTHFVAPGCPLDEEAADRGTSTYLVDRRLDMLPGLLTTKLCSLTSTEDHFAFSVLWEVKLVGESEVQVVDVSFCKSLIRSVGALSYQQAQEFLDDPDAGGVYGQDAKPKKKKKGESELAFERRQLLGSGIKTLNVIARRLRAKRIEAGALTLASPEVRFVLDTETQNPLDVQMYTLRDTNALVEEFMLLANITVAKKIVRHFPTFSMLRRHPAPSKRQFDLLCSQAKAVGVELHVDTSKQLQDSLDAADVITKDAGKRKHGDQANPYFNKLLRIMTTRCMMPASYFSSGEVAPPEFHHYGLAAPIYTHFTSPIRRYADVVVHRLLAAAIGVAPLPSYLENKSHLHEISEQLNRRHHAAQLAGRASVTLHTVLYFQQYPTRTDAVITKVKNNGVGVLLPRFGIEGMIFLCEKGEQDDEDVVKFDASRHALTLVQKNHRTLQVFDRVRVKVYVAKTFGNRQELKMDLLDEDEDDEDEQEDAAQKKAEADLRAARKKRKVAA
jgi:exosome complex exonuclease DIS3/RRP44